MRSWILALLFMLAPNVALARREALVIANANYAAQSPLANPANDARAVTQALTATGFAVTPVTNASKSQLEAALRQFRQKAAQAEVALIYFAGHGIAIDDTNYLIPTDAQLMHADDAPLEAVKVSDALAIVGGATRLRIVIVDACRNNPFRSRMVRGTRSIGVGLKSVEELGVGADTIVAYSAADGQFAQDGPPNGNSPFARALARRLQQPNTEVGLLFRQIRDDVRAATGQRQEPFVYSSLSAREFYLKRVVGTAPATVAPGAAASAPQLRGGHPTLGDWRTDNILFCSPRLRVAPDGEKYRLSFWNLYGMRRDANGFVKKSETELVGKPIGVEWDSLSVSGNELTLRVPLNPTCVYKRAPAR